MYARGGSPTWVIRLYDAADEVLWAARLNLLWLAGTLLGGIVLGAGPATLAAYTLARRHARGESFQAFPAFLDAYRRQFLRGTALLFPVLGVSVFLVSDYLYFASRGPAATAPRLATLAGLAATAVIASYLFPMVVHYDLAPRTCLPKASLFALTRPASSVLLLFAFLAVVKATATYPFLALVISVGAWIQLDTWLCLRFFAENEARLRAEQIS
ncbi:YesL family protein [Actinoplanes sp. CA-142083]|uniref:YesL family protein n=1 Tax=Actinoplanes sp. CA-142083 TaxID=3239903 RepID=UPI003D8E9231